MESVILTRPGEVANALQELELDPQVLRESILSGEAARSACTENDPVSAPGFHSWSYTTRRLRELTIPRGWTRKDLDGLALVISPSKRVAVAVSTGDAQTGKVKPGVHPHSKYPKGPATQIVVAQNHTLQPLLFPEMQIPIEVPAAANWQTWLLMRTWDRDTEQLYYELSLPWTLDDDLYVVEWARRLVFEPISFKPTLHDEPEGNPIDVPVRRRT